MRKIMFMLIGVVAMLSMTNCTRNVEEHEIGICIKRPYVFGSDGSEVLMPGRHIVAWTSSMLFMDKTPMKFTEKFTNLTTKDKSDVDFDFYFNIAIVPQKGNILYAKYGTDWYKRNLEPEFRRIIRNKCMGYDMIPITSEAKVAKEIEDHVLTECQAIIKKLNMPVTLSNGNMGKAEPPAEVLTERSKTAASKQRENTLTQEFKNLAQKEKNEKKRATADKAYKQEMSLSNDQFIKLRQLEVQEVAYKKAKTVIVDGSSSMNPTYPVK